MITKLSKIEQLRALLSKIMMYGSIAIVLIGITLHWRNQEVVNLAEFTTQYAFDRTAFLSSLRAGNSYGILTLGIILLMCIPVMRVLLYIVEFAINKNRLYFCISLFISVILATSIYLGS